MTLPAKILTIKNDKAEIARVATFIEKHCATGNIGADTVFKVNLAAEEILVNAISHGFTDDAQHTLTITLTVTDNLVRMTFTDDGVPFNPLEAAIPDVNAPEKERRIGGLGIFLVRDTMDDIQYIRKDGKNHLTIEKRI